MTQAGPSKAAGSPEAHPNGSAALHQHWWTGRPRRLSRPVPQVGQQGALQDLPRGVTSGPAEAGRLCGARCEPPHAVHLAAALAARPGLQRLDLLRPSWPCPQFFAALAASCSQPADCPLCISSFVLLPCSAPLAGGGWVRDLLWSAFSWFSRLPVWQSHVVGQDVPDASMSAASSTRPAQMSADVSCHQAGSAGQVYGSQEWRCTNFRISGLTMSGSSSMPQCPRLHAQLVVTTLKQLYHVCPIAVLTPHAAGRPPLHRTTQAHCLYSKCRSGRTGEGHELLHAGVLLHGAPCGDRLPRVLLAPQDADWALRCCQQLVRQGASE